MLRRRLAVKLVLAGILLLGFAIPSFAQLITPPVTLTGTVARRQSISVVPSQIDLGELPYANGLWVIQQPITIYWQFNGSLPWFMRLYTDNEPLIGLMEGNSVRADVIGLVSEDGKYNIPIRAWSLNAGPSTMVMGWPTDALDAPPAIPPYSKGITDPSAFGVGIDRDLYRSGEPVWSRVPDKTEMTSDPSSWKTIQGVDPLDSRRVTFDNPTGDFTLGNPLQIYLALDIGPLAAGGRQYRGNVVIDFISQ